MALSIIVDVKDLGLFKGIVELYEKIVSDYRIPEVIRTEYMTKLQELMLRSDNIAHQNSESNKC